MQSHSLTQQDRSLRKSGLRPVGSHWGPGDNHPPQLSLSPSHPCCPLPLPRPAQGRLPCPISPVSRGETSRPSPGGQLQRQLPATPGHTVAPGTAPSGGERDGVQNAHSLGRGQQETAACSQHCHPAAYLVPPKLQNLEPCVLPRISALAWEQETRLKPVQLRRAGARDPERLQKRQRKYKSAALQCLGFRDRWMAGTLAPQMRVWDVNMSMQTRSTHGAGNQYLGTANAMGTHGLLVPVTLHNEQVELSNSLHGSMPQPQSLRPFPSSKAT